MVPRFHVRNVLLKNLNLSCNNHAELPTSVPSRGAWIAMFYESTGSVFQMLSMMQSSNKWIEIQVNKGLDRR
jgi:hypothetical protein